MAERIDAKAALKMAYEELARRRAEIEALKREKTEAIAVVGMACKFPGGADTPDSFWELLDKGRNAVTEIPLDRWDADAYYDADPAATGKMATRFGAFLKDGDLFDYQFFGISPKVAQMMDPQQRLLLEVAWQALENANLAAERIYGSSTGVFFGITCFDHAMVLGKSLANYNSHAGTSSALNMASGRLSYTLGLTGPSMVIDTACSSSLVAIHLACQSLRQRESDIALAGGVHYIASPEVMVSFSQARMLAPDGRCKTFDASADGYVRGEGCGVIVLKRLSDALRDGDAVIGVVRGSAVNQDGASGGLTVPSGAAQQEVIRRALEQAGVAPRAVSYVEAHGTGTSLGDPIEIDSVAKVYGEGRSKDNPILIGSVKTNIGHLEPASGVAGLIKVLLSFKNQRIPPHLHFNSPNPHVAWDDIPVAVASGGAAWSPSDVKRIAGISAFGFSGTNAHLIVEEPPHCEQSKPASRPAHILTLSAKSEESLFELARSYSRFLDEAEELEIGSVCQSANAGRSHFNFRIALVASSIADARARLSEFLSGSATRSLFKGEFKPNRQPRIAFILGGEPVGEPLASMLYETQQAFRRSLDRCREIIGSDSSRSDAQSAFAVNYALAQMWKSWGVEPLAVSGRGRIGRLLAEHLAGVIALEDALRLSRDEPSDEAIIESSLASVERNAPKLRLLSSADEKDYDAAIAIGTGAPESLDYGALLHTLARLYVRGVPVDWLAFEGEPRLPRVALPNYPFQRRRCALEDGSAAFLRKHLYAIEWEEQPRRISTGGDNQLASSLEAGGAWLILSDRGGCGQTLEQMLRNQGQRVMSAFAGASYERVSDAVRVLDPTDSSHFERLIDEFFQAETAAARRIVNLWSLDAAYSEELEEGSLNEAQRTGCVAMLNLARALAARQKESARVWIVTRGAVATVLAREKTAVAQAPLWGFAKALGLEHPEMFGAAIDLDPQRDTSEAATLIAEISSAGSETQIALRSGSRFVPRVSRAAVPELRRLAVSSDSTYIVTGGLGALGLRVADWLVSEGARYIVLLGRSARKSAAVEQAVRDMQSRGASVTLAAADVADSERLGEVFKHIAETAPPVRGIVHAAGVAGYAAVDQMEQGELEAVLRPKVSGAWQLHRLTREMELDFFICFSSIASAWGSRGQAHYAAANSFLDALAEYRRAEGLAALSINWGPWADGGMISAEAETLLRRVGARPMAAEEAIASLAYLPATGLAQVVVADIDWDLFTASYEVKGRRPLLERLRGQKAQASEKRRTDLLDQLERVAASERAKLLTAFVQREAAQVLGLDSGSMPHPQSGLFEMGMDSLMALEFRTRLEAGIAHSLPATFVFDHPTIEAVAAFILRDILSLAGGESGEQRASERSGEQSTWTREPVAVIGIGCRFPGGANGPESYWRMLRDGRDAVTEIPAERWSLSDYYDPDPDKPGRMYCKHGGFLSDVDKFDASFFRISPREAASLDPQQRLALEVSWEALEHAGIAADRLKGTRTGVFIGITTNDYAQLIRANQGAERLDGYFFTGNPLNTTAGRISYALGLEGPSMAIDTACSSSLVSVHQACQSLRSGESDMALAGGVNLVLAPENSVAVSKTRALSAGGRCKTFDASADGFVRSEGCGMVVLKLLSRAVADGDRVLAVIRGSAVNQDGASSGFTVPNGKAQQAVIRQALGQIDPADVDYVEAHGTGTALGDPVEVASLTAVYGKGRPASRPLMVGSVKTNIGHAESAAGIASLIKVVLSLTNGEIAPSIHFREPNPHIAWDQIPVRVCDSLTSWISTGKPRLAGVSAFGASGTNAHMIVEQYSQAQAAASAADRPLHLLTLSAQSAAALVELATRYRDHLASAPRDSIGDICFTANAGRAHFRHRLALACSSAKEAADKLAAFLSESAVAPVYCGEAADAARSQKPDQTARHLSDARHAIELAASTRDAAALSDAFDTLAKLYCLGVEIDWAALDRGYERRKVTLPTYPFQRKRFWINEGKAEMEKKDHKAAALDARREALENTLREKVARLLEAEPGDIDVHLPFLEMGADSIVLVEAVHLIESEYGVKLSVRQFFEELSTIAALASYVSDRLPAEEVASEAPPLAAPPLAAPAALPEDARAPQQAPSLPALLLQKSEQEIAPQAAATNGGSLTSVERILIEQNRVMAQLMNQQLEILRQTIGGGATPLANQLAAQPAPTIAVEHQAERQAAPSATSPSGSTAREGSVQAAPSQQAEARQAPVLPWGRAAERQSRAASSEQQRHLESLIARYTARTRKSKELTAAARPVLADSRASVGFRYSTKEMLYPITGVRSAGSRMWDIDGNEYIDFTMGFGVHLFGHQPPFIQEAITEEFKQSLELGARSRWAGEVAQLFCELTGHERAAFSNTGTEAVMTAMRLARAGTGRDLIAIFTNSYHGHSDGTLARAAKVNGKTRTLPMVAGVPASVVENVLVLDYCTDEALDALRACGDRLAAVMVEPVQSRHLSLDPREFLHSLRRITQDVGAALIFDEMITGFRVHQGGAQALFGVQADLATYGKIVGGGMPIGVVAGTARFMDGIDGGMWNYGDASFPAVDRTAFGGTFCQHPLSMAAARAVLRHLKEQGPQLQARLNHRTAEIAGRLNEFFSENEAPVRVVHFGSLFRLEFSSNLDLLFYHLLEKGIYIWEWRSCFLSTAHTDEDVDRFIDAVKESIAELQEGGYLPKRAKAPKQPKAPRRVALSEAQKQLWLAAQIDRNYSVAYNVNTTIELSGPVDAQAMNEAFAEVVARHEAFRTYIDAGGQEQVILPSAQFRVAFQDLSALDEEERGAALSRWREEESRRAFDLTKAPLLRATLIKLSDELHVLSMTAHHIISDGTTMGVVLAEVAALYGQRCGKATAIAQPSMQFADYLALCDERRRSPEMAEHESYWLSQLREPLPVLQLPCDRARPAVSTYRGNRLSMELDSELGDRLRSVARENGATLFMALLAGFTLMLHRVSQQSELIAGTPIAGRPFPGSQRMAGYCTHVMPLRSRLDRSMSFADYLRSMRKTLLDAFEHQEFPFAEIVARRREQHDVVNAPIVSAVFNLEPVGALPEFPGLSARLLPQVVSFTYFDFFFNLVDSGKQIIVDCDYSTDLFEDDTIRRLLKVYETILREVAKDPRVESWRIALLDERERKRVLVEWNNNAIVFPEVKCLHHLFEAQAARTPDAVALVHDKVRMTYRELNEQANRLANHLAGAGVGPETPVGICTERNHRMVIGLLAILKAGGAYVPLDPTYPRQRLAFVMEDARIRLVLTERALDQVLPDSQAKRIHLDAVELSESAAAAPSTGVRTDNPAYVIYTSGSTGRPKGAAITHRNAVELMHWARSTFSAELFAGMLASTSICFDSSVFEIFATLSIGGKIIVAQNVLELPSLSAAREVSFVLTVPSGMAELVKNNAVPPSVRAVALAGEPLHKQVAESIYALRHVEQLYNLYGLTELTVYSTAALIERGDERKPTIGKPIVNNQAYVLDENLQPLPVGVAGELYIGGAGLGRGYVNRPDLTAEKFIPNPFTRSGGQLLYKTGDRARYRADGSIEFLGRIDRQVKLRGFRIELGEIEAALSAHGSIQEAVALIRDDEGGGARIVAYIVTKPAQSVSPEELRRALRERLPEYMIPSVFVFLEEMPRLPNGKIDRSKLQEPEQSSDYVPPSNEVEETLAEIWRAALGKERVGVLDDFFELGGNSLSATQVAAQIHKRLNRRMEVKTLFAYLTIRDLAKRLMRFNRIEYAPIAPVAPREAYELSPSQKRFWVQDQLASSEAKSVQPVIISLEGEMNMEAFERAFESLVHRHETLRSVFFMDGREPKQRVLAPQESRFKVEHIDLTGAGDAQARIKAIALEEACSPMDLSEGRLLRVKLVRLAEDKHACVCSMHHIITDGWSNVVLLNEFLALYEAHAGGDSDPLPPLAIQYKDYAAWLNDLLSGPQVADLREYWQSHLSGGVPPAWDFPTDFDRSLARGYQRRVHRFVIDEADAAQLEKLGQQHGATLFMCLMACIKSLLYRYTGSEDIVVGTPVAGRIHSELENQIGPYLNVLPIRDTVRGDDRFVELLKLIRETTLDAYAHQLYPFDFIMADLGLKRDSARNPIFDVGFTLQNQNAMAARREAANLKMVEMSSIDVESGAPEALTDFWFVADRKAEGISMQIVYNGSLFTGATVERMAEDLSAIISAAAQNPDSTVGEVRLSAQPEPPVERVTIDIAFS